MELEFILIEFSDLAPAWFQPALAAGLLPLENSVAQMRDTIAQIQNLRELKALSESAVVSISFFYPSLYLTQK